MEKQFQEWQRLAWVFGGHDCGTDTPTEDEVRNDTGEYGDHGAAGFASWAEHVHGDRAREFITVFDALTAMRAEAIIAASLDRMGLTRGEVVDIDGPRTKRTKQARDLAEGDVIAVNRWNLYVEAAFPDHRGRISVEVHDANEPTNHDIPGAMIFAPDEPIVTVSHA